jgi:hypothetical protein
MFAQTVTVPFVGCPARGQSGWQAPKGADEVVRLDSGVARKLAYYQAAYGSGVLAPRGWHCFGIDGSDGIFLFVSPLPIKGDDLFGQNWAGLAGSAVQVDNIDGSTSGRFEVAEVIARVFPARRSFVQNVIDLFDQPASRYEYGPYPKDKLIRQTDRLVEYQTPPRSEGLGTVYRLKPNDDPVDGVAILKGETPDLLMLRVRLPREQRELAPVIIQELLVRQSGDAR